MNPELPSECQEFRVRALERAAGEPSSEPQAAHDCAECARWGARLVLREGLLRSLPRQLPPSELDQRSEAAAQAGARQERAVEALRSLGRIRPEPELDRAVEELAREAAAGALEQLALRQRAPSVLDRLVAEELADPAKARVARQLENLERQRAPAELAGLVALELSRPRREGVGRRSLAAWGIAAAALVLVALVPMVRGPRTSERPPRSFRVEVVESTRDLSPSARAWIETASSGMLSQHNI